MWRRRRPKPQPTPPVRDVMAADELPKQPRPLRSRCPVCDQHTLIEYIVELELRPVTLRLCTECDQTHCPRCRQYSRSEDRYCNECGHLLSLPRTVTVPDYPPG